MPCLIMPYQLGFEITTFFLKDIDRLYHLLKHVLSLFSEFTQKLEIYGPISSVRKKNKILPPNKINLKTNLTNQGAICICITSFFYLLKPHYETKIQEIFVFGTFFFGAFACLICSALFHTFYCYSPKVCKIFNK